ncbi:MAG TPA: hypothetical protein DEB06_06935 [Phycisphaerales bacterium]|nr:hypothetical protein [Phycisphaerales bacterium]
MRPRAFTLVEILIVVVILGILAAIVIPQFSNASQESIKAALRGQMKQIDDQVEVYRVNNAGLLPTVDPVAPFGAGGEWGVMVSARYLRTEPFNMYAGGSVVGAGDGAVASAAAKGSAVGWFFVITGGTRLDVFAAGYEEATNRLSNE